MKNLLPFPKNQTAESAELNATVRVLREMVELLQERVEILEARTALLAGLPGRPLTI